MFFFTVGAHEFLSILKNKAPQRQGRNMQVGYYIDKRKEPENFYALCRENFIIHSDALKKSYDKLISEGVPEKYIYMVHANRDDDEKKGNLIAYQDIQAVDRALHFISDNIFVCHKPDVFVCVCVDLRDIVSIRQYISESYFPDALILSMLTSLL
jgi:hypothetical protein